MSIHELDKELIDKVAMPILAFALLMSSWIAMLVVVFSPIALFYYLVSGQFDKILDLIIVVICALLIWRVGGAVSERIMPKDD